MIRIICFTAALATLGASARADEYWIAYEGNDFPEDVGWTRSTSAGGADRWIEDGVLVIDSTRSTKIFDDYRIDGISDPDPGELFVAEWRFRLDEFIDYYDARLAIARTDAPGHIKFEFALDHVRIRREWKTIPFEPGVFHTFRVESHDMNAYDLFIDGRLAFTGLFESQSFLESFVVFGDGIQGAASLSRWDYVRFGVIPEPTSASLFIVAAAIAVQGRRRQDTIWQPTIERN